MTAPARPILITRKRRRGGFTVAESLIASVVLAIAVLAVSGAIIAAQNQTAIQESNGLAIALGRELMEEICSRPLLMPDITPGWRTVTDRSQYDTINDYNGYTDTITADVARTTTASVGSFSSALPPSTVITSGTTPSPSGSLFTRTVSVSYPTSVFSAADVANDYGLVSVTVNGANGVQIKLSRLVAAATITR
jgi:Tfp pilus assembly protein PilV